MTKKPKVSVYITNHNYAAFLRDAIESALNQTLESYELVIIDDASTDSSKEILKEYAHRPNITILHNNTSRGLVRSARKAIETCRGEYIMRLDSDDWLDENALLILSTMLDKHPDVGLVYPDYFETDKTGEVLEHIRRKKVGSEVELPDLPAHGACTMIRRKCYDEVGGYDTAITRQDGYDLWLKLLNKHAARNINLPLFYYRKHGNSLSDASKSILKTRRFIKRQAVRGRKRPRVLGIIPTRMNMGFVPCTPLTPLAGNPLVHYPIKALGESMVDDIVITSEDEDFLKEVRKKYTVTTLTRPRELAQKGKRIEPTLEYILSQYPKKKPDVVVVLYVTSPFISGAHIDEAVQTLMLYDADRVISVKENRVPHYQHHKYGLRALQPDRVLQKERDLLFESVGSLAAFKTENLSRDTTANEKVGHILLTDEETIDINNRFDWWLAEHILKNRNKLDTWMQS